MRSTQANNFSIKEQIPVEAVYAYIECKHSIDTEETLDKALQQVRKVKEFMMARFPKANEHYEEAGPIYQGRVQDWPRIYPKLKNQPFAVVFARKSAESFTFNGKVAKNDPDLIVLGANKIVTQSVALGADGIKGSLFLDEKHWATFRTESAFEQAFGVFVLHVLAAINWIELVPIDWTDLLNNAYLDVL